MVSTVYTSPSLYTLSIVLITVHHYTLTLESFRCKDEDDNENGVFPILSTAHARTNVILAGKCDSNRHSTKSFRENVVVAKQVIKRKEFYHLAIG